MELNKIYNEDCLVGMKKIPDASVDCIICDLPYGTTACKWDSIIPFEPLWEQYHRVLKTGGQFSYLAVSHLVRLSVQATSKNGDMIGYGKRILQQDLFMPRIDL